MALLEAGGPSQQRTSLGQAISRGVGSYQQGVAGSFDQSLKDMLASQQMQDKRRERTTKEQQAAALEQYISSLPAEQQAIARAFPAQSAEAMLREQKAAPGVVGEYNAAKREGLLPANMTLTQYIDAKRPPGTNVNVSMGGKLTPGQEAIDKDYAKQFNEWTSGGGFSDAQKQIQQLDSAANMLTTQSGLTGPAIGLLPEKSLPLLNPRAASVKESVEEVVQRNLRLILGAQFTEKEGERLISRAYNIALPQEENARRLKLLTEQVASAARAKQEAADYFSKNGTLRGWNGSLFGSFNQFLSEYESRVNQKQESQEKDRRPLGSIFK
jgi:hypothetical protein